MHPTQMEEVLMTQALSAEERARMRKQWTDLAVKQAQEGEWEEAITTNRNIINLFPLEPEAYNRLGKAYSELGQYAEAHQAYAQTLKINPNNTIAKKNLERLEALKDVSTPVPIGANAIDSRFFIAEPGKAGTSDLINLASAAVISRVNIGDKLSLAVDGHRLLIRNAAGEIIGQVEPRLANRLITYMQGGNRYAATIMSKEQGVVRVILLEEYQHPSMFGKVSFTSQSAGEVVRAYTKDSMLRHDREDDDELGVDEDDYYDGGDEADEMSEVDFEGGAEAEE
jgi:tetratricopeptide (TPR) repeat protein